MDKGKETKGTVSKLIKSQVINHLEGMINDLTFIYDNWEKTNTNHYQLEYVYNLRAITDGLRRNLKNEDYSLKYISEKLVKLYECANVINETSI